MEKIEKKSDKSKTTERESERVCYRSLGSEVGIVVSLWDPPLFRISLEKVKKFKRV